MWQRGQGRGTCQWRGWVGGAMEGGVTVTVAVKTNTW